MSCRVSPFHVTLCITVLLTSDSSPYSSSLELLATTYHQRPSSSAALIALALPHPPVLSFSTPLVLTISNIELNP
jgi:hypothetical protein